jgi:small GTP-binding protein
MTVSDAASCVEFLAGHATLVTVGDRAVAPGEVTTADVPAITAVDVSQAGLTNLPPCVEALTGLTWLKASRNEMAFVPDVVFTLTALRELDLERNQLGALDDRISDLVALERLYLPRNRLTALPEAIGRLKSLRILNVRNNRLAALPAGLGELTALIELDASENVIAAIDDGLAALPRLQNLYLSGNDLTAVPAGLPACRSLKSIALSSNALTHVDLTLFALPELAQMWLYGNPLQEPPASVAALGLPALRSYAAALRREGEHLRSEARVTIVGPARVGKSSLVDRLVRDRTIVGRRITQGIDITSWEPAGEDGPLVRFWDFGGQGYLHAAHRMFLQHDGLVVLVVDEPSIDELEYWIQIVLAAGPESRVLVVVNKIDSYEESDVNRRFLKDKYPTIAGFVRVSLKTGENVEALRDVLGRLVQSDARVAQRMPDRWRAVRERLAEHRQTLVPYEDYVRMCAELGVGTGTEQRSLLAVLEALGAVVVMHDDDGIVIAADADWLVKAVYQLARSEPAQADGGVLHAEAAAALLTRKRYTAAEARRILGHMVTRGYCFRIDEDRYLFPSLLPEIQPDLPEPTGRAIGFVAEYPFLPPYLVGEVLSELSGDRVDDMIWRTGVLLASDMFKSRATLVADVEARRFTLQVWGDDPRSYLSVLRHRLASAARGHAGLACRELIPLPGTDGLTVPYHEVVGLDHMQERLLHVGAHGRSFFVQQLLEGRHTMSEPLPATAAHTIVHGGTVAINYGAGGHAIAAALDDALAALIHAMAESDLSGHEEHATRLADARASGDPEKVRSATLAALEVGAKVAAIATAATTVLHNL